MAIPTEPIGSPDTVRPLYEQAIRDTIQRFEATGSPVITDGEQSKPSFVSYPIHGLETIALDGVAISFADGHVRQLPRLTAGPFSPALSLLYPQDGVSGYSRDAFLDDLVCKAERDIRRCLTKDAHKVQIDFTEGRLAIKLDPTKQLLGAFVGLNRVLERFTRAERQRIGVHTCPGGDKDSTHSADVDYGQLLPSLFELNVGNFHIQIASEKDRGRVLAIIKEHAKPDQKIFVGVIDPINPRIETPEEVRDRVLEAADFIPLPRLGTTDDCGFAPFGDATSTSRDIAFAKIKARVAGTKLAAQVLRV